MRLAAGGSGWIGGSDSTLKRNIREVDYQDVLQKVAELPISQWSFKSQDENLEHIGPMAQDFYRLFGLGEDDKHINTLDPDGVALAAIKAQPAFASFPLVRMSRLSVMPVTDAEWKRIEDMST